MAGLHPKRISVSLVLSIVAVLLIGGSAFAADPVCKSLIDANEKIYTTPVHIFGTETAAYLAGKTRMTESIFINNKGYVQSRGRWHVIPGGMEEIRKTRGEALAGAANMSCRQVRDEAVNGEAATLYTTHFQTPDEKVDTQIWISKSRAIPLKQEIDLDVGGAAGKSHKSLRYEYKNVQPPVGVQ